MPENTARGLIGTILYWAAIVLCAFGLLSTVMSVSLFEGEERLWGTLAWAGFTLAAFVASFAIRKTLMR